MTTEDTEFTEESSGVCGSFLWLSAVCRSGRRLSILLRKAAFDGGTHFFHQALTADKILRLNRRMKNHRHLSRPDRESCLRHGVMRTHYCYRNYGNSTLHSQIEWTLLERQQLAVKRTPAFHVNGHIDALFHDDRLRRSHRFDAGLAIAAVDRHQRSHAHRAAENRNLEQLFLHHHRSAPRNQRDLNRRVKIRNVIGHENIAARVVE